MLVEIFEELADFRLLNEEGEYKVVEEEKDGRGLK